MKKLIYPLSGFKLVLQLAFQSLYSFNFPQRAFNALIRLFPKHQRNGLYIFHLKI